MRTPLFRRTAEGRLSIRFRLGLAVAAALSPVLALGVLQATLNFNHDAAARRTALTQAAQRSVVSTRTKMQAAAAVLETLTPQTVGLECAPRLASLLDHVRGYDNFIRFNAIGRVQCAAGKVGLNPGLRTSDWFTRLSHGQDLAIVSSPPGLHAQRPAILTAMRAERPGGGFDGALVAIIAVDSLRPDLSDPTLPPHTDVALADAQGQIAASTAPDAFLRLKPGWTAAATSPAGLLYKGRDMRGRPKVQVVAPLLGNSLFVVLSAPAPGVMTWAKINAIYNIVLPLLAWLAAWAAVWAVTDRVVIRWLNYLDRIASIYAKGRFSVRPVQAEKAPREIRALAETLDAMADAIVARDLSLRESLAHKDSMMREIHHRVKNNLQVITSLLNMQQRALKDPAAREAMGDTRQRITALALIYRALYQSPDLRSVDLRQFLEELVAQFSTAESGRACPVRTDLEAEDLEIDPDKLAPLALFTVEAISEARKHVFASDAGGIHVRFALDGPDAVLEVSDDGVSDPAEARGGDVSQTLMQAFARQLRGRAELEAGGVRLIFPRPDPPVAPPQGPFQLSSRLSPAAGNPVAAQAF